MHLRILGKPPRQLSVYFLCALALFFTARACSAQTSPAKPDANSSLASIRDYISKSWTTLERSLSSCDTLRDPKLHEQPVLYVPANFQINTALHELEKRCGVKVVPLPKVIRKLGELDPGAIHPQGLLYLEHPYVVPGGRFNEMYGWDSYFIIRGLLRDGHLDLAQNMVDNFLFEVDRYGDVLNANRTYYLTRSQPPFLTSMILAVYEEQTAAAKQDTTWLAKAYAAAVADYENWISLPKQAGDTGLSRFYDFGDGPAPESLKDEQGLYRHVATYFLNHPDVGWSYLVFHRVESDPVTVDADARFSASVCDLRAADAKTPCGEPGLRVSFNDDYYKGDRAMRESGYDISFRFGPYGAATTHFAPVCLNSLLYKTEHDLETISNLLGRDADAALWRRRAAQRKENIQKFLWDSSRGMYFDYDFTRSTRSTYEYLTTFFPLWVGVATPDQASAVAQNLKLFEQPGGLVMSPYTTGTQWDFPYAWAPNQLIAVEGLRRYGFVEDANRVSQKFLSTVVSNFCREGTIREKYDAAAQSSQTSVTAGYSANVVGFGWTNAVFLELLSQLPPPQVQQLSSQQTQASSYCAATPAH